MSLSVTRRHAALLLASAALVGGTATGAVAAGTGAQALTAYSCDVTMSSSGILTAGYYSGNTVTPSTSQVTAAGKEAQCLLQYQGYNPGTVDGIFGSKSQSAARLFQSTVNGACKTDLDVDGKIGKESWPHLRRLYC
ncbi:peptidoglycan-binding domain-containing protein [Streptomyces sp. NPDC002742]|jgi:peptidoglycan hydrolase-like protein with peptidoglycan-binding domain|uniref:peptidoglycan-binding domain-containing protein n=1 Tax=unclassified Streptomyces TaxID=2593676 RepID=UPI003415718C